ncbi:hypothetical protein L1887_38173 [Cichorium endivia]|nr:hypothetical protein L1887_38173 [Cichorium endivia]
MRVWYYEPHHFIGTLPLSLLKTAQGHSMTLDLRNWTWSKVEVKPNSESPVTVTPCAGHSLIPWEGNKFISIAGHSKDPSEVINEIEEFFCSIEDGLGNGFGTLRALAPVFIRRSVFTLRFYKENCHTYKFLHEV